MATLEESVRDQISLYVAGYKTADGLNDSLPDTAVLDQAADDATTELVMLVIGYLAEYQRGDRLEVALRDALSSEVSWSLERTLLSAVSPTGLTIEVRAGAGTPLRLVSA